MQQMNLTQILNCPAALDYLYLKIAYPNHRVNAKPTGCFLSNQTTALRPTQDFALCATLFAQYKADVLWNFEQTQVRVSIFDQPESLDTIHATASTLSLAFVKALVQLHHPDGVNLSNDLYELFNRQCATAL